MNRLKLFVPVIIFAVLAITFYLLLGKSTTVLPSALVGRPFPIFALPSVTEPNRVLTEKDLLGDYALVNVWGTWCPTCRIEHPYLLELKKRGVKIFGLNSSDENQDAARDWLVRFGNPAVFHIADTQNTLGIDLGIYGAPETFLINPAGMILHRHVGEMNETVWQRDFLPKIENRVSQTGE